MTVAFILAGGFQELGPFQESVPEALLQIGQQYMVEYVAEALREVPALEKIIIAGPEKLEEVFSGSSLIQVIKSGLTPLDSFEEAFHLLPVGTEQILVATCDLPLLTSQAVQHFLQLCRGLTGDFFYPIIRREIMEKKYPGVVRTYVQLKEGFFTGGNLLLIKPAVVQDCLWEAAEFFDLRKKPLALLTHLNRKLVCSYVLGRLSLADIEKEVSRVLHGVKGVGVIVPYPEIGFDLDKPEDLILVKQILGLC